MSVKACASNHRLVRRDPLEVRKATVRSMLAKAGLGLRFNEHIEGDGPTVFAHACKMGLEGIVSKRKDSAYRSGCARLTGSK
jgi:bifunctional non-homologous end joining protein LigD